LYGRSYKLLARELAEVSKTKAKLQNFKVLINFKFLRLLWFISKSFVVKY